MFLTVPCTYTQDNSLRVEVLAKLLEICTSIRLKKTLLYCSLVLASTERHTKQHHQQIGIMLTLMAWWTARTAHFRSKFQSLNFPAMTYQYHKQPTVHINIDSVNFVQPRYSPLGLLAKHRCATQLAKLSFNCSIGRTYS